MLQHRSETAKRYPGHWGIFGGGIEVGEEPEMAMRREILEELEYIPKNPTLILSQSFENKYKEGRATKYVFIDRYDESQVLKQHEGQGLAWFSLEKIRELPVIDHDMEVYETAAGYLQQ